jgi:CRISPR-associated protein Csb2
MGQNLLLTIRLHGDGQGSARYHGIAQGAPEWPPSPARVFQAVVCGCARGNLLPDALIPALEWWEGLPPPIIAAPRARAGQRVSLFVPNNDADSVDDPRDVSGIRTKKVVHPTLFEDGVPLFYAWPVSVEASQASAIVRAVDELYQLGRGTDMAWAVGDLIDDTALEGRLAAHRGTIHRPESGASRRTLPCPVPGSLASLIRRHMATRLHIEGAGRTASLLFTNAPKPHFVSVGYEHAQRRVVYQLRDRQDEKKAVAWPLRRVAHLVEAIRDGAADRLRQGLPKEQGAIERTIVGRKVDGKDDSPAELRAHIVPLPSIGHEHADREIRRITLEVPSGALVRAADVEWAISGLEVADRRTGSAGGIVLTRTDTDEMSAHYRGPARRWRSVTPVVLPEVAQRRRIEPTRKRQEAKSASERMAEEDRAGAAVRIALGHAGVHATAVAVAVRREPFEDRGTRAEAFADGTRFAKERLWHVEVELDRRLEGPLVIGDGRFLGLGVMAPVAERWAASREPGGRQVELADPATRQRTTSGFFSLAVATSPGDQPTVLARALRRAVMARAQEELGNEPLGRFFSGHEEDGDRARADASSHLAFQWDAPRRRLLVIAPHWLDRREPTRAELRAIHLLDGALEDLLELRAGSAGRVALRYESVGAEDTLLAKAASWRTVTPYTVTRHRKKASPSEVLIEDAIAECARRGFPRPRVRVSHERGVSGRGLEGYVRLDFAVAVRGPIVLGRTRYLGGGLFEPVAT